MSGGALYRIYVKSKLTYLHDLRIATERKLLLLEAKGQKQNFVAVQLLQPIRFDEPLPIRESLAVGQGQGQAQMVGIWDRVG